ncbi:hypothetical protein LguiA_019795 [Lonicera macranthoides]
MFIQGMNFLCIHKNPLKSFTTSSLVNNKKGKGTKKVLEKSLATAASEEK